MVGDCLRSENSIKQEWK